MPLVRVSLWSGRNKQQKAELASALTQAFVEVAEPDAWSGPRGRE
jgi:phenylpyruvate tautomerase PptA (4-oxalocrotonate tautomerase family)